MLSFSSTKERLMKRFHVHVGVTDIDKSIAFYSSLFGAEPAVLKAEYAKWMLDDPRINFAISMREAAAKGIEHVGLQVEDKSELEEVYGRLKAADRPVLEEGATTCCGGYILSLAPSLDCLAASAARMRSSSCCWVRWIR